MVKMNSRFSRFLFRTHVQGGREGLPTNVSKRIQREGGLKIFAYVIIVWPLHISNFFLSMILIAVSSPVS